MTLYRFSAIGHDGRKRRGQIEASDRDQARYLLSSNGDLVLDLEESGKRNWLKFERRIEITPQTASDFALELSGLLSAGASLRKALDIQVDGDGAVARFAASVRRDIEAGRSLSLALRSAGGAAETLAEFAAAGEAGAGLDELMAGAGRFLAARGEAVAKIKSALAYPIFILALAIIAIGVITLYVAPALAPAMEQSGEQGMIVRLSEVGTWLNANSAFIFLTLAALVLVVIFLSNRSSVRKRVNQAVWRLPMLGSIARDLDTGQSCDVLAALLQTGRSMETSLQFAAAVSGPELAERYRSIGIRIRDGQTASAAFSAERALPKELRRLALLGEQSSTFGKAIEQAGRICHDRALRRIDKIAKVLGPALVIGLGVGVSLLMISVLGSLSSLGEIS
ncbi:MAG: type II secretion system F family protein [Alphaproteobacteria bacterium]|nr:type II secretion system F family protein [Alphaproteobacteria bacterium]